MRLGPGLLYEGRTLQGARPKLADFCSATMAEFYSAVDSVGPDGGSLNRRKSRGCSKEPRLDGREGPDPRSDATRTLQDVADQGLDRWDQIQRQRPSRFIEGGALAANAYVHRCRQRVVV